MRTNFEQARLKLVRLRVDGPRSGRVALSQATRISAITLGVERVGIWLFEPEDECLRCLLLYGVTQDRHEEGDVLLGKDYPAYFAAMRERRTIAAGDARIDPATMELAASYLGPRSIGALLDAPLYRDGEMIGVVCHEHIGAPRVWTGPELDFACSVADIVSALLAQQQLREYEDELRVQSRKRQSASRLDAITHMTRALVHDFGNVLTATSLIASLLATVTDPDIAMMGRELAEGSAFGVRLLRDLKMFVARGELETASIGEILEAFAPILSRLLHASAELVVEVVSPDVVPAAPRTHIEQILMNLCVNAGEAFERPGTVTIRAELAGDPDRLLLVVRDDGPGIPAEIASSIFDDYFTTKEGGSGLGLAIVRDLAAEHGGTVELESTVGVGTTVTVQLPVARPPPPAR